jgi:abortive infection bacteriophage resistance protein
LFKEEYKHIDNQLIFVAIYIIQRLLTRTEGNRFVTDLEALILEYEDDIEFAHIGFPINWKELLTNVNNKKS